MFPRRALRIASMELTQSIQHHGAAGTSYGPDNSVPLVALKTLVVRVYPYVREGIGAGSATERITGELVVSRRRGSAADRALGRPPPFRQPRWRRGFRKDRDGFPELMASAKPRIIDGVAWRLLGSVNCHTCVHVCGTAPPLREKVDRRVQSLRSVGRDRG